LGIKNSTLSVFSIIYKTLFLNPIYILLTSRVSIYNTGYKLYTLMMNLKGHTANKKYF